MCCLPSKRCGGSWKAFKRLCRYLRSGPHLWRGRMLWGTSRNWYLYWLTNTLPRHWQEATPRGVYGLFSCYANMWTPEARQTQAPRVPKPMDPTEALERRACASKGSGGGQPSRPFHETHRFTSDTLPYHVRQLRQRDGEACPPTQRTKTT